MIQIETWLPVVGYIGFYEVSNLGGVKSLARVVNTKDGFTQKVKERILKQAMAKDGALRVMLYKDGINKCKQVHVLVAQSFIPNPYNKKCVNHLNVCRKDNYVENLEWATKSEDLIHAYKFGNKNNKGEKHHNVKLTEKQVLEVFSSKKPFSFLSNKYKISQSAITSIKRGRTWYHVTGKMYNPKTRTIKERDVLFIFNSQLMNKDLAKMYNVDNTTISHIKTGKNFSSITGKFFTRTNKKS